MTPKIAILNDLRNFFEISSEQRTIYCRSEKDFTNCKKLPFVLVVYLIMNMLRRTLALEIEAIISDELLGVPSFTKSAFSQARYKIAPTVFIDANTHFCKNYYSHHSKELKRWKGFVLQAVDGSTLQLPESKSIISEFGKVETEKSSYVLARTHIRYDVLNRLAVKGTLAHYDKGERALAAQDLPLLGAEVLSLYDMGYAGSGFFYYHKEVCNRDYVCRISPQFNIEVKRFAESEEQEAIVCFRITKSAKEFLTTLGIDVDINVSFEVRLIKVLLDNGVLEILATSLLDLLLYPKESFKALYGLRWGVETFYDKLKNKLQVEIFSGLKAVSVYQDFYATILVSNIHSMLVNSCEEQVKATNDRREKDYAVNQNISLGILKNYLIALLIGNDMEGLLSLIEEKFVAHLVPITMKKHSTQSSKRQKRKRHVNGKYHTLTNYKRAF